MDTRVVEVTLQGRAFSLRTDVDPATLDRAVEVANARLDELGASGAAGHTAALLATLSLAEELVKEREAMAGLRERIRSKSTSLLEMLHGPESPEKAPGGSPGS